MKKVSLELARDTFFVHYLPRITIKTNFVLESNTSFC